MLDVRNNTLKHLVLTIAILLLIFGCNNTDYKEGNSVDNVNNNAGLRSQIDSLINYYHESQGLSLTMLIAKNDSIIYQNATGFVHPETKEPLSINSPFNLASVSKQFITMCAMILNEDNKLDYDQNVKNYVPDFPYDNITVRHLMTHTSGLPEYFEYYENYFPKNKIFTNQDMLEMFIEHKPNLNFSPGDKYSYSNTGYLILVLALEKAAGKPLTDFITEKIIKPLNLANTFPYNLTMDVYPTNRVYGHRWSNDSLTLNDLFNIDGVFGDGNMYSSATDLQKWSQALYNNILVSDSTLNEAFTPFTLNNGEKSNYGFGWGIDESNSRVSHSGGWVGFSTYIQRDLKEHLELVILTNSSFSKGKEFREKVNSILELYE